MGDQIYLPTSEGAAREGTGHVSEDSPQPGHWLEAENGDPRTLLEDFLANHALPLKIKSSLPFFPPDVLQALFTPKVIEEKLSRVCAERGIVRHVKGDVQRIIGRDPDAKAGTLEKSWLKIFALLVLVQRESDIFFWIDSELGISDGDLPLVYKSKSFYLDRSSTTPLRHFGNWDLSNLRAFDRKQWQVKVPVFTSGETDPLPHRDFEEREILPFLDVKDKDGTWYPEMLGGYGTVECVRLPSSCYDFTSRYGEGKVSINKASKPLEPMPEMIY
jgi:hypothetical protein